jgi:hypothetical protein
VAPLVPVIVRV